MGDSEETGPADEAAREQQPAVVVVAGGGDDGVTAEPAGVGVATADEEEGGMAVDMTSDEEGRTGPIGNPWPFLEETYAKFVNSDKGKITFNCLLCRPRKVLISVHFSSLQNLKSHVKRLHANRFRDLEDVISLNSRRGKNSIRKAYGFN